MTQIVHQPGYTRDGHWVKGSNQTRKSAQAQAATGRHASGARKTATVGGASLFFLSATITAFAEGMVLLGTVLTILTVTLLGALGWMKRRQVRRARRKAWGYATRRVPARRSKSPARVKAEAEAKKILREQRYARRDEVWGRRKAAAVSAARVGVAKVRAGWSQ